MILGFKLAAFLTVSLFVYALQSRYVYRTFVPRGVSPITQTTKKFFDDTSAMVGVEQSLRVGMDLTASYGTVAVGFPNGSLVAVAKVEGDSKYRETIHRLSLQSSEHPHPPYDNMWDSMRDQLRQARRRERKAKGLPASKDVSTIATMIKELQQRAENHVGVNISSVVAVVPHLRALYDEDVMDAFEYARLQLVDLVGGKDYEYEPNVAYAGYGLGLCKNYTSWRDCDQANSPSEHLMVVLYTKSALAVSNGNVVTAYYLYNSYLSDIELGHDARNDNPNEDYYWEAVRDKLRRFLVGHRYMAPRRVLLTGESALDEKFQSILRESLASVMDELPQIYCEDPLFVVARGALEFVHLDLKKPDNVTEQETVTALELPGLNEPEL